MKRWRILLLLLPVLIVGGWWTLTGSQSPVTAEWIAPSGVTRDGSKSPRGGGSNQPSESRSLRLVNEAPVVWRPVHADDHMGYSHLGRPGRDEPPRPKQAHIDDRF